MYKLMLFAGLVLLLSCSSPQERLDQWRVEQAEKRAKSLRVQFVEDCRRAAARGELQSCHCAKSCLRDRKSQACQHDVAVCKKRGWEVAREGMKQRPTTTTCWSCDKVEQTRSDFEATIAIDDSAGGMGDDEDLAGGVGGAGGDGVAPKHHARWDFTPGTARVIKRAAGRGTNGLAGGVGRAGGIE